MSDKARIKVNEKLITWADVVFVMERKHKEILNQKFPLAIADKILIVLGVKDNYCFGDEELPGILNITLADYL